MKYTYEILMICGLKCSERQETPIENKINNPFPAHHNGWEQKPTSEITYV